MFVRQSTRSPQVRRIQPDTPLAHPLDDGTAACLYRDLNFTAEQLCGDSRAYRCLMKPLARNWDKLADEFLRPILHWPQHPIALARFGLPALCPAIWLAKRLFKREATRALFAGIAAHSFLPLEAPASSAFALVLGLAGHAVGWPIPRGGSQQISNALANCLRELGGKIEVNCRIQNLNELPKSRVTLLDVSVWEFLRIAGERMPLAYRHRLESFRHAPGVFKIDYALSDPIPWKAEDCRRAGTIHLGGTIEEIAAAERDVSQGRMCYLRSKVFSTKRARPAVSIPSGHIATLRLIAGSTCRITSNLKSSDSLPVFAIVCSPATA
jgi:phytoene dehydrogenase-like protein